MNEMMDPKDRERFANAYSASQQANVRFQQANQVAQALKQTAEASSTALDATIELLALKYGLKKGDTLNLDGSITRKPEEDPTVAATLKTIVDVSDPVPPYGGEDDDTVPAEAGDLHDQNDAPAAQE